MELGAVGTLAGLLATLVFGVWAILLSLRARYPGRLTFFRESSIGLVDDIVRNLPELSITYRGEPVGEGLILLKGFLLNSGEKDISRQMVEEPLTVTLPEGHRWLSAKVVGSSPKIRASLSQTDDRSLTFDLGLFRRREFIKIEALAEVSERDKGRPGSPSPSADLASRLQFHHRIGDTRKVERRELKRNPGRELRTGLLWAMFGALAMLGSALSAYMTSTLHYVLETGDGRTIEVTAQPQGNGLLKVAGVDTDYEEMVSPPEFFAGASFEPRVVRASRATRAEGISIIVLFFVSAAAVSVATAMRERRLRRLLKES